MQAEVTDGDVMIPHLRDIDNCTGCARCQLSCRGKNAITMSDAFKPIFDTAKCATCFSWHCVTACPDHNIILLNPGDHV